MKLCGCEVREKDSKDVINTFWVAARMLQKAAACLIISYSFTLILFLRLCNPHWLSFLPVRKTTRQQGDHE